MTKQEMLGKLQAMVDRFNADDAHDWAYWTVEDIRHMIEECDNE
jgi:hypothetical protein